MLDKNRVVETGQDIREEEGSSDEEEAEIREDMADLRFKTKYQARIKNIVKKARLFGSRSVTQLMPQSSLDQQRAAPIEVSYIAPDASYLSKDS